MKILQMVDVPWDSGLAHYALTLAQGLKQAGHQVFVSALPGQKPWHKARRLGLKTLPLVSLKGLKPLRQFIRDYGIHVVNAHTGQTHSLAVASALGSPVAVIRTRSDARQLKPRLGTRFIFQHTHRVITAADYIRDSYVKTLHLSSHKVVTVYQGLSLAHYPSHSLPKAPIVGIVARLDPVKGHRYLLEAIALLKGNLPSDFELRIIGQEENVKQHDLETQARRSGIDSWVKFLGYQSSIPDQMAQCSIGVIASTGSEAVSRVALEWMAAGRPVVATRVGCLPEIVMTEKTGLLIPPKDPSALAKALWHMIAHPSERDVFGRAGRHRIEALFTLPAFVKRTEWVYHEALQTAGIRGLS